MTQPYNDKFRKSDRKDASAVNEDIVRKYIDLFDRLPIGIYRTTPEGRVLTANPAFLSMLGYTDAEDLEDIDLNKTHKGPQNRLEFVREIEEKGEIFAKESVLVDRNGKEIVVEEYAKVFRNADGDPLFYEGIVINITEKKKDRGRINYLGNFKDLIFNLTTSFINIRLSDIDDQIVYSLKSIGDFIGADRSYVFLFDDDEMTTMSNSHEYVAEGVSSVIDELQDMNTADYPWWIDNLKMNRAIIVPDVYDLSEKARNEKEIFIRQGILSLFAVPMFFDYRLIGFLGFDMVKQYKVVDDETLDLLNITASLFANILNYQKMELNAIEREKQLEKQVEERTQELSNLNKQLRLIAESSNDVVWTMDVNLQTTYMSPSVMKQLGYTQEEYTQLPLDKRLPPESVKKVKEVYLKELDLIKAGKKKPDEHSSIFEMLHMSKSGEMIWGEVSFNFLFDKDGNINGIHGITRNIQDRKKVQTALWESNERFKALVENTSDWIWEVDVNGNYTYVSPMSEHIFGFKPDELIGKSFSDFLDPVTKQDALNYFRNIAGSRIAFKNLENVVIHKNGRKVYLETSGIPIYNIAGEFTGYRGIDRDVSEKRSIEAALKHSQLKLTQHLRNTPMGYIEWDTNFEVIEWNPAAQKLFGYNKTEAMMGNMILKLVPPEIQEEIKAVFPQILGTGKPVRKVNYNITRDGNRILCEWFNTPLFNAEEQIIGLASLVREITESH